ncbi:hypothetical protein PYJP_18440 [Pyrofollis japonicus]|uniref:amidohydrolase family protein n=1 Tax=Pyrofollis japonicus TaxID=3060460 RepID=UPI00295C2ECB|nr:amidohydrolase family protein [Pyrofollis japonicus]BEP18492.1 hypothetical protein PYJP_18440 [Pyrofollis japonicus]
MHLELLYAFILTDDHVEVVKRPCIQISDDEVIGFTPGCPPGAQHMPYIVLPGLCNAHIHVLDYSIPEIGEDKKLEELVALPSGLKYTELQKLGVRVIEQRVAKLAEELRRRGILYLGAYSELGDTGSQILLNIFTKTGIRVRLLAQPLQKSHNAYLSLLRKYDGIGLDTIFDLSEEELRSLVEEARRRNAHVHVHISETEELYAGLDYKMALRLKNIVAVHLTMLSIEELKELARNKISLVFCPRSNLYHVGRVPNLNVLDEIIGETLVGLGTDNAAWITPFVHEEMSFTYTYTHSVSRGKSRKIADAIIRAATISCVKLLGLYQPGYEVLEHGAVVAAIPEIEWSLDPLITLVKRLSSYQSRGLLPNEFTSLVSKLAG